MKLLQKKPLAGAAMLIMALAVVSLALSGGKTGVTRKNGSGCTCHGSASSAVTVAISGPSTLAAGATGNYSLTITGGPLVKAGTDIAASSGTLANSDASLKVENGELTHNGPKLPTAGAVTFAFKYTAPASTGTVTLYGNGNSVNGTGNSSGDQWNFAPDFPVTVTPATAVENENTISSFSLAQNYPNPFNPSTRIDYSIQSNEYVSLKVYNAAGEQVATLAEGFQNAGSYSVAFIANQLTSGIYFYRLNAGSFTSVRKMILTK